jgi:hypothetical protein
MKKIIFFVTIFLGFSLQSFAHVNLLNPTGGEVYAPGDTVTITWQIAISHTLLNWDLFYSEDGGTNWDTIQIDIPSTGNTVGTVVNYEWVVPNIITTQAMIWIYMDNAGTDYDDKSGVFTIDTPTGLFENESASEINLYPNPVEVNGDLRISLTENAPAGIFSAEIMDLAGRTVMAQHPMNEIGRSQHQIKLIGLKPGTYFVILRDSDDAILGRKPLLIF